MQSYHLPLLFLLFLVCIQASTSVECSKSSRENQNCSQEYNPVCGHQANGNRETFQNACEACQSSAIEFYSEGTCESYPELAVFCVPSQQGEEICPRYYLGTCGIFSVASDCTESTCGKNYSNACVACGDVETIYVLPRECM